MGMSVAPRPTTAPPPFEILVRDHGPAVLRFCAARVGTGAAEDCFQQAMLSALRGYGSLRSADSARAWLLTIAARTAIDMHRAAARSPLLVAAIEEIAGATGPEPLVDDDLWARVDALSPKQREAVLLRFVDDLTHVDIGRAMNTSEAAARRNVHDALRRLRSDA